MVVYRNGFTYAANIIILTLTLALFLLVDDQDTQFRVLGTASVSLGAVTTLIYIITVPEKKLEKIALEREAEYQKALSQLGKDKEEVETKKKFVGDWLKEAQFYIFGIVYMFARIAYNTTATIMPLYLDVVTEFKPEGNRDTSYVIAAVPLASYLFSFIFSLTLQNYITEYFKNRVIPMALSVLFMALGSLPMAFLRNGPMRNLIYPLAAIQGVGNALLLNTSTACISDVIGKDNTSAAFVYGAYSLVDKFANGFLLFLLVAAYSENATALAWIIAVIPTISAVGCFLATWLGIKLYADKLSKMS